MKKKVLVISYYWPPAGGPGVQRWLKFIKYLPSFGYIPYVYVPKNPSYPIIDCSLEKEINPNLKIIKNKIWEPYKYAEKFSKKNKDFKAGQFDISKKQSLFSKLSIFIRGNFFIPDARIFWKKPSVSFLKKYLKKENINTIITTGPPHSIHLIGLSLKQEFPSLKWIADFRDPWTQISYYTQLKLLKISDKKHRKLEKKVLQTADAILSTSYTDKENFEKLGAKKVICITNGFDTDFFSKSELSLSSSSNFVLSYIGMLEDLRNPVFLWDCIQKLIKENKDFKVHFKLNFVGKVSESILDKLRNTPLNTYIDYKGYLSHQDAIKIMQQSNLLLLTNFPSEKSKGIIPGKLFEYLASGNTILSVGPKDSDVQKILKETKSGEHFQFNDSLKMKNFILSEFEKWKNNKNIRIEPNNNIQMFHRKNLTEKLVKLLNNLS